MSKTDKGLVGNEVIEKNIEELKNSFTDENLAVLLTTIRQRIQEKGQFVVGVSVPDNSGMNLTLQTVKYNGAKWFIAFTSFDEELKGKSGVMSGFLADIDQILDITFKNNEIEGIILNPYGNMISLNKSVLTVIKG